MPRLSVEERVEKIEKQRAAKGAPIADPLGEKIDAHHQRRGELLELAEQIILSRSDMFATQSTWGPRRFFSQAELAVFDGLAWSDDVLRREIGRVCTLAKWQSEAGTSADRADAQQRLVDATATLDERGPQIASKIEKLQRELRGLERDCRDAKADVDRRAQAVKNLRDLVPPSVKQEHSRRMAGLAPLRTELGEVSARLSNIQRIVATDIGLPGGRRDAQLIAHTWAPELVRDATHDYIDSTGWQKFANKVSAEIPSLKKRQAELQGQLDHDIAEIDALLDHYAR